MAQSKRTAMRKRVKKVVSLVGARPQFIKLSPLAPALSRRFGHTIVHSGQHYDFHLSEVFFRQLAIPAPNLNLAVGSADHGRQTGKILDRFERYLKQNPADLVIVYGDTNTTLAGALTAAKLNIPVAHVEAGLRSFRETMPEEINRKVADAVSSLLLYPTPSARKNLIAEGIRKGLVNAGDVMYEILAEHLPEIEKGTHVVSGFGLQPRRYILVTLHRAENVDDPGRLKRFIELLRSVTRPKVFLAHPRTMRNLRRFALLKDLRKIPSLIVSRPMSYLDSLSLINYAAAVLTDSGGMQKEACFLGTPCLTMRRETEWLETVSSGRNVLIDLSATKARRELRRLVPARRRANYRVRGKKPSEIISSSIAAFLSDSDG